MSERIAHTMIVLLLFTATGCFHKSADEAVLAPVVAEFMQHPASQSKQREYVVLGDELTAKLFRSLRRDPRYRIVPSGKAFVCPPDETPCPRPYVLNARVDTIMGDTAIANIRRIESSSGSHDTEYSEQILLVRRNGRWVVEKVLGYSATVFM